MTPLLGVALVVFVAFLNRETPEPVAHVDRVVLLPDENGKVGRVVVKTAVSEETLATAYAGVEVGSAAIVSRQEDAASVATRFGAALGARPPKPLAYIVYFISGRDELTPESKPVIDQLKSELGRRPVPELTVIGHTDRVGKLEANDLLSRKRAEMVRGWLIEQGVPAAAIESAGRGEREPLVPTADEVAEPRNRRVEISVR